MLYRLGLRPGELNRLTTSDLWLEPEPVLYVRSRRGRRTKSAAGQRQIPLAGRMTAAELAEVADLVGRCRDAETAELATLMSADVLQRITLAMREASGDCTLVPYHLRHAARTHMVVWAGLPAAAAPPGMQPRAELIQGPADYRERHFGAASPTRRTHYQEAVIAGHASPSTTLGVYTHLLDWICHRAVLSEQPIDDGLLAALSGYSTANVRQIRSRAAEPPGSGNGLWRHALSRGALPAPPELAIMRCYEPSHAAARNTRTQPASLRDVAEALRRWCLGETAERIARRLDYEVRVVSGWIAGAEQVSRESGYPVTALLRARSHEAAQLSAPAAALSDLVCGDADAFRPRWLHWLAIWRGRYIHRLGMPYFAEHAELAAWVQGLLSLGYTTSNVRIYRPRNMDDPGLVEMLRATSQMGITAATILEQQRSVCARSGAATGAAGIGVSVAGLHGRVALATELARYVYLAAVALRHAPTNGGTV